MSITSKIDQFRQSVTISAIGKMRPNEIVYATELNLGELQINKLLLDLRFVDIEDNIVFNELENVYRIIKKSNDKHINYVKTAIVASTDLWFKVAQRILSLPEKKEQPYKISVFRFKEEAIDWLFAIH